MEPGWKNLQEGQSGDEYCTLNATVTTKINVRWRRCVARSGYMKSAGKPSRGYLRGLYSILESSGGGVKELN